MSIEYTIKHLLENYALKKKDIGPYHLINGSGMHFVVEAYDIVGVGKMSAMTMQGMFGLMKMTSLVITPLEKEMPLFSMDLIHAMGKHTYILELYQTSKETPKFPRLADVKDKYKSIPNYRAKANWYDSIRLKESIGKKDKEHEAELEAMVKDYVSVYMEYLNEASAPSDAEEKLQLTKDYVDTLIEKGGPAVNQFKKILGEKKTGIFLRKYMFGSED